MPVMSGETTPNISGIVGGSGFIGKALAPRLAQHHGVRVIDIARDPSQPAGDFAAADVRDKDGLAAALQGCTEIVHLAAAHADDVEPISEYFDVNVGGTRNVCAAATALGIRRIVFASSAAVFGLQPGTPQEDSPQIPAGPYGESKRQAEEVLRQWQQQEPQTRELVIVRPSAVFGIGNRANIWRLMAQAARDRFVMIGPGTNCKSMAYVENVAAFFAFISEQPLTPGIRAYNYADKPDIDMNAFCRTVREALGKSGAPTLRLPYPAGMAAGALFDLAAALTGRKFPISRSRVQKFCADTVMAADLARKDGFEPPFTLREALSRTVAAEFGSAPTK
jgi:nucleoside-diphosphate-sugar epimerase